MVEKITDTRSASRGAWESLESWAREKVQDFVQALLEEKVTELLGRAKSVRRATVDAAAGSRNGHGKPRRLTRLEKDKAAVLVAIGGLSDGRKVVLAVMPGQRESTESWSVRAGRLGEGGGASRAMER